MGTHYFHDPANAVLAEQHRRQTIQQIAIEIASFHRAGLAWDRTDAFVYQLLLLGWHRTVIAIFFTEARDEAKRILASRNPRIVGLIAVGAELLLEASHA